MTVLARVRAPATTANVGPGFDCVAVALDLWNELEVREGGGEPDLEHLGVRAFALLSPVEGRSFAFTDRIPRERGLGSSAAVIALGLVAAAVVEGRGVEPEELLSLGVSLEGHPDNLAAALAGGVCLTWEGKIAKVADRPPAVPIAVVPDATVSTRAAREQLPSDLPHADAAFSSARAALLGAAVASGSADLFAQALDDRLHEPYRKRTAPLLDELRGRLPEGALGVTISGSGPSVIVWAHPESADACAGALADEHPETRVLPLAASPEGAHPV
jgi:homoserine kinase